MSMSNRGPKDKHRTEVDQIQNIAETKGVEIEDIEVKESSTEDGDDLVVFRIYSADGPKVQVSKMPNVQTAQMTFRDDVQNKISALKRHITTDGEPDEPEPAPDEGEESDSTQSSRTRTRNRSRPEPSGSGPGAQLDAEIEAIHDRLDELEGRIEELEDKSEALDGLQQLMNNDD